MNSDPATARPPTGPDVDGRRLLGEAVGFGRALRAARLAVDLGAAIDFARALTLVDLSEREQVRAAGEAIFTHRRDDLPIYDAVFARWWRRRGSRIPGDFAPATLPRDDDADVETQAEGAVPQEQGQQPGEMGADERGIPIPSEGDDG